MAKEGLFKQLPTWSKGVIALIVVSGVVVVTYAIYKKAKEIADKKDDKQQLDAEQEELSNMNIKPTLNKAQAEAIANAIFAAFDGYASDELAVYSQLAKLKNNADWLLLSTSYGTREISSGRFNPEPNFKGTLTAAITSELEFDEIQIINKILKKNGVTYTV